MKTATSLRLILFTLATGAAGAVFGLAGSAHAAVTQSFQISPPTANYAANPGEKQKGTVKVTNLTNAPLLVKITKQNFVAKGEEGEIELVDDANPLYSLSPWFVFDAAQLDIPPLGTKELHYTVDMPANAEPGGRYGAIVFNTIPPKLGAGQSGASVQQQIASIAFLRINGKANESVEVVDFKASPEFAEAGPVKLTARVKNTGNVHEKPTGTIVIKDIFGFTVDKIALDEHFVIPGATRRLVNDWPTGGKHRLLFGRYTAELSASYGDGQKLTASTSFTIVPWRLLAVVFIILVILFLVFWRGRKRLNRALRILAGRE